MRRTITLWQLDIADKANLKELNGELLQEACEYCNRTSSELADELGAVLVRLVSAEESLLLYFESAVLAIEAASILHRSSKSQPWHPYRSLFRSSIVTVDIEVGEEVLEGPGLKTSEALAAEARAGQILVGESSYIIAREATSEDHAFLPLGVTHLEDGLRSQRIFQLLHPELPSDFRPLTAILEEASHLPTGTTPFIGRNDKLVEIGIGFSDARVINLTGFGGIGKSRLAIESARALLEMHYYGACYIDLSRVEDEAETYRTIATQLGVKELAGMLLDEAVLEKLRKTEILLVFDNVNQSLPVVEGVISRIIELCPDVQAIVTSRKRLHLANSVVIPVGPMTTPPDHNGLTVDALAEFEAVQLFLSKANLVDRTFELNASNWRTVAQICRTVEGIPLSIELAAAKLGRLDLDRISEETKDRLKSLARGRAGKQPGLERMIHWSFESMATEEQALFLGLSVFSGEFNLDAAVKVATEGTVNQDQVSELLDGLVKHAFIYKPEGEVGAYYRMLETIRDYGITYASKNATLADSMIRYADYYTDLAKDWAPKMYREEQSRLLSEIDHGYSNFVSVLRWCLSTEKDERSPHILLALYMYWSLRSLYREGLRWCLTNLKRNTALVGVMRGRVLCVAGVMAHNIGDYKEATRLFTSAHSIGVKEKNQRLLFTSLGSLGNSHHFEGNLDGAVKNIGAALEIARKEENETGIADCANNLANALIDQGELEKAEKLLDEAEVINSKLDRRYSFVMNSFCRGRSGRLRGDLNSATHHFGQALLGYYEIDSPQGVSATLVEFALIRVASGSNHSAATLFGASEAIQHSVHVALPMNRLAEYEQAKLKVRKELGYQYAYDFQRGTEMSREEILEFLFLNANIAN